MLMIVILYAVLASTFILAKSALMYARPCFLIGFRMIFAGLLLLGFEALYQWRPLLRGLRHWKLFFKTSLFHIYLAFILEFWALQYMSSLKTTLIYSITPFVAALLSYLLLNERLTRGNLLGICIGIGGLMPVLFKSTQDTALCSSAVLSVALPDIALLISVVSASYAWFLVKRLMNEGYSLAYINGITMLTGGILSMITAGIVEGFHQPVTAWMPFLGWVTALILVANILVYNLYGFLLRRYSITFLTFSGFLCPSFGTIYEWLFMGGTITWHYPVSLLFVTLGLYIFYAQELTA